MRAVIFDLDETLVDTRALRGDREHGRWRRIAMRLEEVGAYVDAMWSMQAEEMPASVRAAGLKVGVLTHSPRWYAEQLLSAFGIPCDALISGSDGYARKPDPGSLHAIAKELGVAMEDCVVVGDDAGDIGAAHNACARAIGVAWSRRAPASWRRCWPDVAAASPDEVIDALEDIDPRLPFAEAVLATRRPVWHWGSLLRLGESMFGAGRYYTTLDGRHGGHALSRLIIRAKEDERSARRVGGILADLMGARSVRTAFGLVTSVPPRPGQDHDRFAAVRVAVARACGAVERGDVLRQRFDDADYKHAWAEERPERVRGRFASVRLNGEHVLLIDDVITSGSQAGECRRQLLAEGAKRVTVLAFGVTQETLARPCPKPECDGILRTKTGRHGEFIGCSNYRRGCLYKEPAPEM